MARPWPCRCEPERQLSLTVPRQRGQDVLGLQLYLRRLGLDPGPADGVYGPRTAAAIKEFQRRCKLPPDGVVREATWAAIGARRLVRDKPHLTAASRLTIVVDVYYASLFVLDQGKIIAVFPVALGKIGTPTPVGSFRIKHKAQWGGGFGSRWMGLDVPWGVYGIHGTNRPWSIGGYESHGCIRMFNADVEQLYELVPAGTPVHVIGDPFYGTRSLGPGETGSPVAFLQRRLRQLGFYRGAADGYYSLPVERAVMAWQKSRGLKATGRVEEEEIRLLRLRPID
ncbi:MAG: L,D-transpeptidase family protein [Bacteroidota bacterium]